MVNAMSSFCKLGKVIKYLKVVPACCVNFLNLLQCHAMLQVLGLLRSSHGFRGGQWEKIYCLGNHLSTTNTSKCLHMFVVQGVVSADWSWNIICSGIDTCIACHLACTCLSWNTLIEVCCCCYSCYTIAATIATATATTVTVTTFGLHLLTDYNKTSFHLGDWPCFCEINEFCEFCEF